jgi:hypothetical protein
MNILLLLLKNIKWYHLEIEAASVRFMVTFLRNIHPIVGKGEKRADAGT